MASRIKGARYKFGDTTSQGTITKVLGSNGKRNMLYEIECNKCGGTHERRTDQLSGSYGITDCPMYVSPIKGRGVGNKRDTTLRRIFGITLEEYLKAHDAQQGCCAICRKSVADNGKALAVDHCHTTGKIRGLLCDLCNRGLGMFKDNTDSLVTAIQYLRKYSEEDTSVKYIPIRVK
ncbi:Recombination endonuclease VII [uncultured Caudovirales phage]|uniref:Recombination endonuclease VII n=1 Tax=uncultured Caudovirales phage TaxID=2100421 RepID=A0A6J5PB35_9CAUD|nr:Recombination endonuclease VII [uncultured Caudovirales phage]CAB4168447.1 Recombination endonuclease VII [uncultured Caudovirales phage]CAB4196476.1 Recombination endonuclease VII [uncultured Caudovirales phage]CAB4205343.1 Recombination endonuclease VII [uncultured Caudovirales phage]